MSLPSAAEQRNDLRHQIQLLVQRTADLDALVEELAASAEWDLQQAPAAASPLDVVDLDQARALLSRHAQHAARCAAAAVRLRVSARAQHAAACRLLADADEVDAGARRRDAVLVVDDYSEVRELVARVLHQAGFVVRTAANGLVGLIAAHQMRPTVIVMDVSMPVLDGIEATRLIKAADVTRDARVIAYTGEVSLDTRVVQQLFAAVLQKPATAEDVLATVRHVAGL